MKQATPTHATPKVLTRSCVITSVKEKRLCKVGASSPGSNNTIGKCIGLMSEERNLFAPTRVSRKSEFDPRLEQESMVPKRLCNTTGECTRLLSERLRVRAPSESSSVSELVKEPDLRSGARKSAWVRAPPDENPHFIKSVPKLDGFYEMYMGF